MLAAADVSPPKRGALKEGVTRRCRETRNVTAALPQLGAACGRPTAHPPVFSPHYPETPRSCDPIYQPLLPIHLLSQTRCGRLRQRRSIHHRRGALPLAPARRAFLQLCSPQGDSGSQRGAAGGPAAGARLRLPSIKSAITY